MRLSKNQVIEGLAAEQARALMRLFRPNPGWTEDAADLLELDAAAAEQILYRFTQAGYLEPPRREQLGTSWITTIQGSALANASFAKPITRATAERHLQGFLDRVRSYNADHSKPYTVTHVTVFGSYLDPDQDRLGDLDLAIQVVHRVTGEDYAHRRDAVIKASGRRFGTYIAQLTWPLRELVQFLRDRKPAINITDEDVTTLTERWSTLYEVSTDTAAEQPPPDAVIEYLS
ncbi:MAG TPA: hypothetical protein VFU98_00210 [Microlunatus sp.]|nr:hypothetical protein [Microlunatus sp.]